MTTRKLLKPKVRRKSPARLVRQLESGAWEILGDGAPLPVYESREAALRATDLTVAEKVRAGGIAHARKGRLPVVLYWDVMAVVKARGEIEQ